LFAIYFGIIHSVSEVSIPDSREKQKNRQQAPAGASRRGASDGSLSAVAQARYGARAKSLRAFAGRIAAAPQAQQRALFEQALALFRVGAAPEEAARWEQLLACAAFHETAVAIYRATFAERGFQFGAVACNAAIASSQGLASSWRAGDAHAAVHRAATPALALLRAAAADCATHLDEQSAAQCSVCGGSGWFIMQAGGKEICRHGRDAA
jgi:hypothetical protein